VTELYHATSREHAQDIVGPPSNLDVTRGSGEFGVGFYFQKSKGLAGTWAENRYGDKRALVCGTLSQAMLHDMKKVWTLDHKKSDKLRTRVGKAKATFLSHWDLIIGTIDRRPRHLQYKFETKHAEIILRQRANLRIETL